MASSMNRAVRGEREALAEVERLRARLADLEEAALAACFALTKGNKDLSKSPVFSRVAANLRAAAAGDRAAGPCDTEDDWCFTHNRKHFRCYMGGAHGNRGHCPACERAGDDRG